MTEAQAAAPDMGAAIEELIAKERIREVLFANARAMDRGDAVGLAATYHEDAVDIHWATFTGLGLEFAEYMTSEVREIPRLIHEIFNVSIALDGDRAFAESRCTSHIRIDVEGAPPGCWVEQTGRCRYLDIFQRRGGEWRIAHRRIVQEGGATSLVTDQPDRAPDPEAIAAPWPEDLYYRGYGITDLMPEPVAPRADHWAWLHTWGAEKIAALRTGSSRAGADEMTDELRRHLAPAAADALRAADPEFADLTEALFSHPYRNSVLSPRIRALVVLSVEAVIPQADAPRLQAAIQAAIAAGASQEEVLCILEISCSIGLHSVSVGLPILKEEMAACGQSLPEMDKYRIGLKAKFETAGPRPRPLNPIYTAILQIDPGYFTHRVAFIDLPWERLEVLDPEVKHLASIAIDAVSPQHYVDGLRKHIRESLAIGVTPEAILEVFELISVTGLRTLEVGMPVLAELFASMSAPQ